MPPRASFLVPISSANIYICRPCLHRLRHHLHRLPTRRHSVSSSVSLSQNPPLHPAASLAFAPLSTRRLVSLSGQDAAHFLQGLTTINITSALQQQGGSGFYSAFLNAAGRVLYDVFIYPTAGVRSWRTASREQEQEGGFLIEVDAREVEGLARHLKRFKLRAKVGIRVVDEGEWGVWARWGSRDWGSRELDWNSEQRDDLGCVDTRAPGMGSRLVLPHGNDNGDKLLGEQVSQATYDVRRMMKGVAEGQTEIVKDSALPQESNIDYMGGIDFRKGCYVGQELTIRTHHTGVVRKRILPVQLYGPAEAAPDNLSYDQDSKIEIPPSGTNISRAGRKGRSAGRWIAGVGNVGLALCRLEIMTNTALTGEGVQWTPEDEFKVSWDGGDVKVKAFVPAWHHERSEAQKVQRHPS